MKNEEILYVPRGVEIIPDENLPRGMFIVRSGSGLRGIKAWTPDESTETLQERLSDAYQKALSSRGLFGLVRKAPAAPEEEVRGWRKTSSEWPVRSAAEREWCTYYVQLGDHPDGIKWAECRRHVECRKDFTARGRPLTLREVVDLIDPEPKVEPGPVCPDHGTPLRCDDELCPECAAEVTAPEPEPLTCVRREQCFWCRTMLPVSELRTPAGTEHSGRACAYCAQRIERTRFGDEKWNGPPTPVVDEDGECWERPGWSEP